MKPLKSKNSDKHLLNTISYFAFFGYPPTFSEIHTFFPEKITKTKLKMLLGSLLRQKRLISYQHTSSYPSPISNFSSSRPKWSDLFARNDNSGYSNNPKPPRFQISNFKLKINVYTLPQYAPLFKNRVLRQSICQKKLIPVKCYTGILAKLPFIRFIGITGSASMGNTTPNDDVDIFIITRKNCLFIGRFFAILFAHIFHVRKGKNSICLNLFFDESDLVIPLQKQTQYVAHEVLQMRPVVNKGQVYERFLKANEWVSHIFPNSKLKIQKSKMKVKSQNIFVNVLRYTLYVTRPMEYILKTFQLAIIRRNKTGLIISPTQLWLFKNDFETRVKNFKS